LSRIKKGILKAFEDLVGRLEKRFNAPAPYLIRSDDVLGDLFQAIG